VNLNGRGHIVVVVNVDDAATGCANGIHPMRHWEFAKELGPWAIEVHERHPIVLAAKCQTGININYKSIPEDLRK
jgi:hypothetical protein